MRNEVVTIQSKHRRFGVASRLSAMSPGVGTERRMVTLQPRDEPTSSSTARLFRRWAPNAPNQPVKRSRTLDVTSHVAYVATPEGQLDRAGTGLTWPVFRRR